MNRAVSRTGRSCDFTQKQWQSIGRKLTVSIVGEKMQRWTFSYISTLDAALHSTSGTSLHIEIRKTAHREVQGLPTADCRTMFYATAAIAGGGFIQQDMPGFCDGNKPIRPLERILRDAKGEVPDQQRSSKRMKTIGVAGRGASHFGRRCITNY